MWPPGRQRSAASRVSLRQPGDRYCPTPRRTATGAGHESAAAAYVPASFDRQLERQSGRIAQNQRFLMRFCALLAQIAGITRPAKRFSRLGLAAQVVDEPPHAAFKQPVQRLAPSNRCGAGTTVLRHTACAVGSARGPPRSRPPTISSVGANTTLPANHPRDRAGRRGDTTARIVHADRKAATSAAPAPVLAPK